MLPIEASSSKELNTGIHYLNIHYFAHVKLVGDNTNQKKWNFYKGIIPCIIPLFF